MSDSCVVYVNEVLYYYFSFIFHLFFTFSLFIFFTVLRSVLLTLLLHNKSAYNLSDSYIYSGTPLYGHPLYTDSFVCPDKKLIYFL